MKKAKKNKMRRIRNMRELELMKENLEYQQLISERKLIGSSVKIVDDFADSLKSWAFEWGTSLALRLIRGKHENEEDREDE